MIALTKVNLSQFRYNLPCTDSTRKLARGVGIGTLSDTFPVDQLKIHKD